MASLKHRVTFYNTLATLEEAGVPPLRGLQQRMPGAFQRGARELLVRLKQGLTISQAMARDPALFSSLEVSLVLVGETTGRRDVVYAALRDWFQLVGRLRARVISALLYPAFVYHAAALLIPLISIFAEGASLPEAATRAGLMLAAPWVCWLAVRALAPGLAGAPGVGRILLAVPVLGGLLFRLDCTRFFTALGLCLRAGVGMAAGVEIAAATCRNTAMRQRFAAIARVMAAEGCSFTVALERVLLALDRDTMIMELMRTGEEAGKTDEAAERVAKVCREEAEARLNQITVLAPNLAYLCLAAYIGYKIVSFYSLHYAPVMQELLE
jgi:type II secretory pathway component PulF